MKIAPTPMIKRKSLRLKVFSVMEVPLVSIVNAARTMPTPGVLLKVEAVSITQVRCGQSFNFCNFHFHVEVFCL